MIRGGSLRTAARLPGMPNCITLYGWKATRPEFARAIASAEAWRDEMLADQVRALAWTPESKEADTEAFRAVRLRLGQLRGGRRRG